MPYITTHQSVEDHCASIIEEYNRIKNTNKVLYEQIEKLKNKVYEEEYIAYLRNCLKEKEQGVNFSISPEEHQRIKEWIKEHNKKFHNIDADKGEIRYSGAIGGSFNYIFTPTSIGTVGTIKCICGEEFTFQDL